VKETCLLGWNWQRRLAENAGLLGKHKTSSQIGGDRK